MNIKDTEVFFIKQMIYWAKRLRVPLNQIKTIKDYRPPYVYVSSNICKFNPKYLSKDSKSEIQRTIFHELGHLKTRIKTVCYISKKYKKIIIRGRASAEHTAEIQALKWMKKYYPKDYLEIASDCPRCLNFIKTKLPKDQQYYYRAFKKIPEYQSKVST